MMAVAFAAVLVSGVLIGLGEERTGSSVLLLFGCVRQQACTWVTVYTFKWK